MNINLFKNLKEGTARSNIIENAKLSEYCQIILLRFEKNGKKNNEFNKTLFFLLYLLSKATKVYVSHDNFSPN